MVKRLDRVKRVPKKASEYFIVLLDNLSLKLKENSIDTRCFILITDTESGYVHFNIEAWSTFKFSLRLSDMKPIMEGKDLTNITMGWELDDLIEKISQNLKAWDSFIKLSNSIDRNKQFILNNTIVVNYESNAPHTGGIFEVEFTKDSELCQGMMKPFLNKPIQEWYGYNHEDAVRNAMEYNPKAVPVNVKFLRTEKF